MENNILKKISKLIIDKRLIVFIAFAAACVYCAMSIDRVKVNDDITAFLPADTDTRRGLTVMEEEFVTYADAKVMLANTTYERAEAVAEEIRALEHVTGVELDDSPAHLVNSAALLTVSFDTEADDPRAVTTVATGGEEPLFLVEGSFREGQELLAVPFTPDCAALGMEEDAVLAAYTVKAPGYTGELTVRMRAPEGERLYVLSDGAAVSHSFTRDGSYIVFALENGGSVIYAEAERTEYLWPAIGGGAAIIAAAGAYLLLRRKKKRPAPAESGEQAE